MLPPVGLALKQGLERVKSPAGGRPSRTNSAKSILKRMEEEGGRYARVRFTKRIWDRWLKEFNSAPESALLNGIEDFRKLLEYGKCGR